MEFVDYFFIVFFYIIGIWLFFGIREALTRRHHKIGYRRGYATGYMRGVASCAESTGTETSVSDSKLVESMLTKGEDL